MKKENAIIPAGTSDLVNGVVNNALNDVILREGMKCCNPLLWEHPICLEPPFELFSPKNFLRHPGKDYINKAYKFERNISNLEVLRIWPNIEDQFSWPLFEDMLKEFSVIPRMISFEVCGNKEGIGMYFTAERQDIPVIKNIVKTKFPKVVLNKGTDNLQLYSGNISLLEWYSPMPYWRNLSSYGSFSSHPLDILYVVWSQLSKTEFGIFQVLFIPASKNHNWHRNVSELIDLEYRILHEGSGGMARSQFYQTPSTYLPGIAKEEEAKAHSDKPFFFSIVRIGVIAESKRAAEILNSAAAFSGNFRYGGRPLNVLQTKDYIEALKNEKPLIDLFKNRVSLRQGMLLNSKELVSFVNFASKGLLGNEEYKIDKTQGFEAPLEIIVKDDGGVKIGTNEYAGKKNSVYIPGNMRLHTYLVGKSGKGKTTTLKNMAQQDILAGRGLAVIDAHGDLIDELLACVPKNRIQDVIYIDFGDRDYIPRLNLFHLEDNRFIVGQVSANLTEAFKSFITSWGARMENLFKNMFYVLLRIPGLTLKDSSTLISKKPEGDRLRKIIIPFLGNDEAVRFWEDDFPPYTAKELDPVRNKISSILEDEFLSRVFSVRDTTINYRQAIDSNKILLKKISVGALGRSNTNTVGRLITTQIYYGAMSRLHDMSKEERLKRPFYFYADEVQRFGTPFFGEVVEEGRKVGLKLVVAHQRKNQIDKDLADALTGVDVIIVFNVGVDDAREAFRSFGKKVNEEEFLNLKKHNAFALIDTHIVSLATLDSVKTEYDYSKEIIENSRKKYYIKASEFKPMNVFEFLESKGYTNSSKGKTPQSRKRDFESL